MNILIISASCCYPGMATYDEQAKVVIEQAIRETGVTADVQIIPGATAIYGGVVPKSVMNKLLSKFSRNETGPAIIIGGEIISYGVPQLEDIKAIIKKSTSK